MLNLKKERHEPFVNCLIKNIFNLLGDHLSNGLNWLIKMGADKV